METPESSKRRRMDCSGGSLCTENVERNDGGGDCKHKVFLCHSGEQKDFVEQMCGEIERHDRSAFFDKNRCSLALGCDFPKEIFKAIEECEVGVVVLSKAFFTKTRWPMQEFARLAKRTEENKEFVLILVFYDIERAECRNEKKQKEWIVEWEKWAQLHKRIVIEDWISVFKLFGPTMSISYDKEGDAKQVIGEVVAEVCKRVTPETRGDDLDMQGRQRICKLVWDKMQASKPSRVDGPRVVGLYGMGGIGKSTLCKAMCEKLRLDFGKRVCHVELACNSDEKKEEKMLGDMVKRLIDIAPEVVDKYNKNERLNLLMTRLSKERVFLAIDNVEDGASSKEQAKYLLNATYAKDSFVVVTARSIEILQNVGINREECQEMPELDYEEAKSLFLKNAPKWACENDSVTRKCIGMCYFSKGDGKSSHSNPLALIKSGGHYHPLALKVLNGQLGYDQKECMQQLEEPDPFNALRERQHPIFSILRSSFDSLQTADQLLFMDVALFFPRRDDFYDASTDVNIMTWLHSVHGGNEDRLISRLKALKRKSLIECIGDGTDDVGMHDLWREFCVNETTMDDSRRQRWFYRMDEMPESVNESRFYSGGWEDLQRVCLSGFHNLWSGNSKVRPLSLRHCSNLVVLKLENVELNNGVVDVSPLLQLKSLEVDLRSMYGNLSDMSAVVDIKGLGELVNLRVLIVLGISSKTTSILEIACMGLLEILVLTVDNDKVQTGHGIMKKLPDLRDCPSLRLVRLKDFRLPSQLTWSNMKQLQRLNLAWSDGLLSCDGLEDLVFLVELNLHGCSNLKVLPCLEKLKRLKMLDISSCEQVLSVPGLDCLVALESFEASYCESLKRLPDLQRLSRLKVLDLRETAVEPIRGLEGLTSLQRLHVHFDTAKDSPKQCPLTNLQDVTIESWGGQGLPCMVGWTGLERLQITECHGVHKLEGLESLPSLQSLHIGLCNFWDVSIVSRLTSLQTLEIQQCKELKEVPSLVQLSKLESLRLEDLNLATWEVCGTIPRLRSLWLYELPIISLLELGHFPELRSLEIQRCKELKEVRSMVQLSKLESLELRDLNLATWKVCGSIPRLRSLTLSRLPIISLLELGHLPELRSLEIQCCKELKEVPSLVQLLKLESLRLEDLNLATWEVCGTIPRLRSLWLSELPIISLLELGHLPELRSLEIQRCKELKEVRSMVQLSKLESLRLEDLNLATWEVCGTIPCLRSLSLVKLPIISLLELGHLPELRSLSLLWCQSLTSLPSDGSLAMLEDLLIIDCDKLEFLPSFRKCTWLRSVYIFRCRNLIQVPSFSGLTRCDSIDGGYTWKR